MTVYAAREASPPRYELHANARKVLRIILGPAPDDPEYATWWRGRLISVRMMREAGQPVVCADEPPVPLPEDKPPEEAAKKPAKMSARSRKKAAKE